jgi:eukaryotic-like serine/threonine-protein kinase
VNQSLERLLQEILALSDTESLRLFQSLGKSLTLKGLQPFEDIDDGSELAGAEVISESGQPTEQDSSLTLDQNTTTLESTSAGSEQKGEQGIYDAALKVSEESFETGQRYKLLRLLAMGGLGRVWVARDINLGRDVALKHIIERCADNPDFQARFMFEAKALANLEHPGVVPIYGHGRNADGRPFFIMRLIQGETFASEIKRFHARHSSGSQPKTRVLELRRLLNSFMAVCNVVAFAHSRGVLHRDIKPDNVMLGKYGEVFLVDWGLAKILFRTDHEGDPLEGPSAFHPEDIHGMTASGAVLGTPPYASPEQAAGRNDLMEPASDIYSLGATLYEILTGRRPVEGHSIGTILSDVIQGRFPTPREISPNVPSPLEMVCLKAMAHRPEDRYSSATALADDIERWLAGSPVSAHRGPPGKSLWPSSSFLRGWWKPKQTAP